MTDQTVDTEAPFTGGRGFVLFLAAFLSCYASVLLTPYAFSDDYQILAESLQGKTGVGALQIAQGRPTGAFLTHLAFSHMNDIGDVRYLRLLGVIGIALLAWSFYRTLVRTGWNCCWSALLSVIVFTMPPFQVYASWATTTFLPFAAIVSGVAFSVAERAFDEQRLSYKWSLTTGSVLLMLLALTIYQPAAMFFWVFAAIRLFKPDATSAGVLRRFWWDNAIVCGGLLLGFGVYKLGMAIYGKDILGPLRSNLTPDLWGKVLWFFRQPLMNALNLTKLSPKQRRENNFPTPRVCCSIQTRWLAIASEVRQQGQDSDDVQFPSRAGAEDIL